MSTIRWSAAIALVSLTLSGCFAAITAYRQGRICTPEAAAQAGAGDARRGRDPDLRYARLCGVAETSLNRIYRDAFDRVPAEEREADSFLGRLFRRSSAEPTEATVAADEAAEVR